MVSMCPGNSRSHVNVLKFFLVLEYVLDYRIFGVLSWNYLETFFYPGICPGIWNFWSFVMEMVWNFLYSQVFPQVSFQTCFSTKYSGRGFLICQLVDIIVAYINFLLSVQYFLDLLGIINMLLPSEKSKKHFFRDSNLSGIKLYISVAILWKKSKETIKYWKSWWYPFLPL